MFNNFSIIYMNNNDKECVCVVIHGDPLSSLTYSNITDS